MRLRARQINGLKFRRQQPIGRYIVDFCCLEHKLVVEIDGGHHARQVHSDRVRTEFLAGFGFRIIRFWDHEVLGDPDAVLNKIAESANLPHPGPLPVRERVKKPRQTIHKELGKFVLSLVLLGFVTLSGCAVISVNLFGGAGPLKETTLSGEGRDKVLLLEIQGTLTTSEKRGIPKDSSTVATVKQALDRAEKDSRIRAVVLRINSPGGTVTASDILYHELKEYKAKAHVPVVAAIMDLGTSGAYYAAMAADSVIAHPTSVIGSIGVIFLTFNVQGLMEKIGVEDTVVKSGDKKDMGSPFKKMSPEERAIFQRLIMAYYDRFVGLVGENRKISAEALKPLADGRVFTAQEAQADGLIDRVGYLDDAIAEAKKRAGIEQARVVTYTRSASSDDNIYALAGAAGASETPTVNLFHFDLRGLMDAGAPQFLYMWSP